MYFKACILSISLLFAGLIQADEPRPRESFIVHMNDGAIHRLLTLAIIRSAEGDVFWFTDEDGFYRDATFNDTVEINRKDGETTLTLLRTGTQKIKAISNYQFRGETLDGKKTSFYLKEVRRIRFITVKEDRICPLGHVWPDTDFLFCPYDGMELAPFQSDSVLESGDTKIPAKRRDPEKR